MVTTVASSRSVPGRTSRASLSPVQHPSAARSCSARSRRRVAGQQARGTYVVCVDGRMSTLRWLVDTWELEFTDDAVP